MKNLDHAASLAGKSANLIQNAVGKYVRLRVDEQTCISGEVLAVHERRLVAKRVVWGIKVRTKTGHEYVKEVRELPKIDAPGPYEIKTEDYRETDLAAYEVAMMVDIGNGERACAW